MFYEIYKVPVFVAEIAPKELRGALTTLNQVDFSILIVTLITSYIELTESMFGSASLSYSELIE